MSSPIAVIFCMDSSSRSWEPQKAPTPWHSRAGGGAVHSITNGHPARFSIARKRGHMASADTWRFVARVSACTGRMRVKELAGKTVFVTGAASGIGLGIATAFAQAGRKSCFATLKKRLCPLRSSNEAHQRRCRRRESGRFTQSRTRGARRSHDCPLWQGAHPRHSSWSQGALNPVTGRCFLESAL
jgi:hypothetical protein